jgi:arsenate reductase
MQSEFRLFNVLFISQRNSARSILAEALLNRLGAGRFEAFSAGYDPSEHLSPYVLGLLHRINYNTGKLATKPVEVMCGRYAPKLDFVIRLAPGMPASGQWPALKGNPLVVDWFLPDPREHLSAPALIANAYSDLFDCLAGRVHSLAHLAASQLSDDAIGERLERLGEEPVRLAS